MRLSETTNQIVLGTTRNHTVNVPSTGMTLHFPDPEPNATVTLNSFFQPVQLPPPSAVSRTYVSPDMLPLEQTSEMQRYFQQNPISMLAFLNDQVDTPEEKRDANWFRFMTALTGLLARRFDYVHVQNSGFDHAIHIPMPSEQQAPVNWARRLGGFLWR